MVVESRGLESHENWLIQSHPSDVGVGLRSGDSSASLCALTAWPVLARPEVCAAPCALARLAMHHLSAERRGGAKGTGVRGYERRRSLLQRGDIHRGAPISPLGDPTPSRHVFAAHYIPSSLVGEVQDRRGAGTAKQYEGEEPTRSAVSPSPMMVVTWRQWDTPPTSIYYGVLPDGAGRAFLRRGDGAVQAGVNGEAGINGDDLK